MALSSTLNLPLVYPLVLWVILRLGMMPLVLAHLILARDRGVARCVAGDSPRLRLKS